MSHSDVISSVRVNRGRQLHTRHSSRPAQLPRNLSSLIDQGPTSDRTSVLEGVRARSGQYGDDEGAWTCAFETR